MAKHVDPFSSGDLHEVYGSLQRDFNRDQWVIYISAASCVALLLGGWTVAGAIAALVAIFFHVDNSNRNWAMHVIDYLEWSRRRGNELG